MTEFQYPKVESIKRALFIQPHPDDNEIAAGGTMAYLRSLGAEVFAVSVTQGDGGSDTISPEALVEIRNKEAQRAAEILDVSYLGNLGYNNLNPGDIECICFDLVKLIRKIKPDAIFSVDPHLENECHPVHVRVGLAVNQAFMRSGQKYYPFTKEDIGQAHSVRVLGHYFTNQYNQTVDISSFFDLKMKAIRAHASQMPEPYVQQLETYFGLLSQGTGYRYAEYLKLLTSLHTHAFVLPEHLKGYLEN